MVHDSYECNSEIYTCGQLDSSVVLNNLSSLKTVAIIWFLPCDSDSVASYSNNDQH